MTQFNARRLRMAGLSQSEVEIIRQLKLARDIQAMGASVIWNADSSGVFPAGDPSQTLTGTFLVGGVLVSSFTATATLASSTGLITVGTIVQSGQSMTYTIYNDGTASVRIDVSHEASQQILSLSWSSLDPSASGTTPDISGDEWGGADAGGSGGGK